MADYWDPSGYETDWDWQAALNQPASDTWYQDTGQYIGGSDPNAADGGGFWKSLGGLASGIAGPLLSTLGSLAGGAIGSNAASDAASLQADALNRGIDLQTAQWLQQQGNLAPYLQAGQQGLAGLQQLAGREQPPMPVSSLSQVMRQWYDPSLPGTVPAWSPQDYQGPPGPEAGAYRWTPQQGPQAQTYRYTPGAVPTLSGQELLANDPGVQFRLDEGRKALEASAAARGGLLSGGALAALQRQGQELSSQEYGNAWGRASQQAQLREQWGQAASTMGWSQAQAEAAFREQMAQSASQQGFGQALAGQQNQFTQGLQAQQWTQEQQQKWQAEQYTRMLEQNKLMYGRDVSENQATYERQQALYRQQLAQHLLPWEQASTLANLGGQAVGMYGTQGQSAANSIATLLGRVGEAQSMAPAASGLSWQRALTGATNQISPLLASLNA